MTRLYGYYTNIRLTPHNMNLYPHEFWVKTSGVMIYRIVNRQTQNGAKSPQVYGGSGYTCRRGQNRGKQKRGKWCNCAD